MSVAILLAGAAGATGVAGAWHALEALESAGAARAARPLFAPVLAAVRDGREPSAPERRRLTVLGATTLLAAGWLMAGPPAGAVAAAAGPWAVARLLGARRRRRRRELALGAPAVARALGDALAGGHSIRGAIAQAAQTGGLAAAARAELRDCASALSLGERTETALDRLAGRAAHPAYDTIVAAVLLQRDAGGDLAGLLRDIAETLEDARRVEADAHAATAQARFTAWLVAGLPVGAAAILGVADPGAVGVMLFRSPGAWLCALALACHLVALLAMRRLARVGLP
jgi:tight adherence protein B